MNVKKSNKHHVDASHCWDCDVSINKTKPNKHSEKNSELKNGVITGFWSGALASLCCIGPLIIILLGLGSISFALSIGQYKPYFLLLGVLFMTGAIAYHLNRKGTFCLEGIKKERNFILSVIFSMVIVYAFTLYLFAPAIAPIIYGNNTTRNTGQNEGDLNKLTVKISEMTCTSCTVGIETMLNNMPAIVEVKINYSKGIAEIIYDPNSITKEQIINSDAFSSYPVKIIKDEKVEDNN